jgi:hypothetical protein
MGSGRRDGRGSVFTVQWQPTGRLRPQISWSLGGPLRVVGVGGAIGTVQAGRGGGGSSFAAPRADTPPNTNNRRPPQLRSTSSIDATITRETLGQARLRQWPFHHDCLPRPSRPFHHCDVLWRGGVGQRTAHFALLCIPAEGRSSLRGYCSAESEVGGQGATKRCPNPCCSLSFLHGGCTGLTGQESRSFPAISQRKSPAPNRVLLTVPAKRCLEAAAPLTGTLPHMPFRCKHGYKYPAPSAFPTGSKE